MEKTGHDIEGFEKQCIDASSDGLRLSMMHSIPELTEGEPKGIIQIVHGMCEHKERYVPFMRYLCSEGYICVIHDHRGHGETAEGPEDLGYFHEGGWNAMVEDCHLVSLWAKEQYPGLPLILFGHSMGSMAVRCYTKRYDDELDALIVCGSPSFNPGAGIAKSLASLIGFFKGDRSRPDLLHGLSFGMFNSRFRKEGSPNAWICSDPEIVNAYDRNPLCNFQFTVNGYVNLFGLMQETYSGKGWKTANPDLPVLFISGEDDPCMVNLTNHRKSVESMKRAGYGNVSSNVYKGMRHEILNEKEKGKVWNDVARFLSANLCTRS